MRQLVILGTLAASPVATVTVIPAAFVPIVKMSVKINKETNFLITICLLFLRNDLILFLLARLLLERIDFLFELNHLCLAVNRQTTEALQFFHPRL